MYRKKDQKIFKTILKDQCIVSIGRSREKEYIQAGYIYPENGLSWLRTHISGQNLNIARMILMKKVLHCIYDYQIEINCQPFSLYIENRKENKALEFDLVYFNLKDVDYVSGIIICKNTFVQFDRVFYNHNNKSKLIKRNERKDNVHYNKSSI